MVDPRGNVILIADGGMVEVPSPVDFHFNVGFLPGKERLCRGKTIPEAAKAAPGRTVDEETSLERVNEITALVPEGGFRPGGFRWSERATTEAEIRRKRRRAGDGQFLAAWGSGRTQEAKWGRPAY